MKDIFDQLREHCGCEYISDLKFPPWLEIAKEAIRHMECSDKERQDLAAYLNGEENERKRRKTENMGDTV